MRAAFSGRTMGRTLLEAIWVTRCAGCGRRGSWVCEQCLAELPAIVPIACTRCHAEYPEQCECAHLPSELDALAAAYPLEGWARSAIHRFKFGAERSRATSLAEHMHPLLPHPSQIDLLVPVPLHRDRHRTRGYNQAELLADELSKRTGIPVAETLIRRVERGHQVGLGRAQRWEAVRDAFACPDPRLVAGRRIVLVDDVITTGATISNCAIALSRAGAASVRAVAFARG